MTQATNAMSGVVDYVAISTNGSAWTDIGGFANSVKASGGDRKTADKFTFDGDTPLITSGKREKIEITVSILYTETGSDPYTVAQTAWRNRTPLYVRWIPAGNTTGKKRFTSLAGVVTTGLFPEIDAEKADALAVEFKMAVSDITEDTVP